jgi:hypothetical protein
LISAPMVEKLDIVPLERLDPDLNERIEFRQFVGNFVL